jgi:hypothetical protein
MVTAAVSGRNPARRDARAWIPIAFAMFAVGWGR